MPNRRIPLVKQRAGARWKALATGLVIALAPSGADAQMSYFNTDVGRPTRIEDALSVERYLLDLHLSPVAVHVPDDGAISWRAVPEATYGVVPRTQVSFALPLAYHHDELGLAGLNIGALYTLTTETRTWPALAVRGDVLMSVGSLAPERTYGSLKGIITRTFDWVRLNVNGGYTFGSAPVGDTARDRPDVRRWLVGGSLDRSFPTRSLLAAVEVYAEQPLAETVDVAWSAGLGLRYQLTTTIALDAGAGATWAGGGGPFYATVGLSRTQAVKTLIPGLGRWGW